MRILLTQKYTPLEHALELERHEVKSFLEFPGAKTIHQMLEEVSPFSPDLVLVFYPEMNSLPPDFMDSPLPAAPVIVDYHLNFQALFSAASFFPAAIINGEDAVPFFKTTESETICFHPLIILDYPPFSDCAAERPIDISFVGQVDEAGFRTRARRIKELFELFPEYQVKILSGIDYHETLELYRQSKIVFNHAVRPDVLNQRTLDALACGALLFVNEENHAAAPWLKHGRDKIAYQESNLIPLLKHFLENPEERISIAENGQQRLLEYRREAFTVQKRLNRFLNSKFEMPHLNPSNKVEFFSSGLFLSVPESLPLDFNNLPQNDPILLNNLAVSLWSCGVQEQALNLLENCSRKNPNFLPSAWNLGMAHFYLNHLAESSTCIETALSLAAQNLEWPFKARPLPKNGMSDFYTAQFSEIFMNEKLYDKNESQKLKSCIFKRIFTTLIQIHLQQKDLKKTRQLLQKWENYVPDKEPERDYLCAKLLREEHSPDSLELLSDYLLERSFSFSQKFLAQTAFKLWSYGYREKAQKIAAHVFKRHFTSLKETVDLEKAGHALKTGKKGGNLLEILSFLEDPAGVSFNQIGEPFSL